MLFVVLCEDGRRAVEVVVGVGCCGDGRGWVLEGGRFGRGKKMEEDLEDLKATTAGPEEVHRRKRGTD